MLTGEHDSNHEECLIMISMALVSSFMFKLQSQTKRQASDAEEEMLQLTYGSLQTPVNRTLIVTRYKSQVQTEFPVILVGQDSKSNVATHDSQSHHSGVLARHEDIRPTQP